MSIAFDGSLSRPDSDLRVDLQWNRRDANLNDSALTIAFRRIEA